MNCQMKPNVEGEREKKIQSQAHLQPDEKRFHQGEVMKFESFGCGIGKQCVKQRLRGEPCGNEEQKKRCGDFQQNEPQGFQMSEKTLIFHMTHTRTQS